MKKYLVSYDLLAPGRNYANLYAALERLGAARVLLSQWLVVTRINAAQLRDHLLSHMDSNDPLLVNDFQDWASFNTMINLNKAA